VAARSASGRSVFGFETAFEEAYSSESVISLPGDADAGGSWSKWEESGESLGHLAVEQHSNGQFVQRCR
jgi:hypothetical protein